MDINQANDVIDRLNAVFNRGSTDIPTASDIWEALSVYQQETVSAGASPNEIPSGIEPSKLNINRETVETVELIRAHANNVRAKFESKKALKKKLTDNVKLGKKLKI